MQRGGVTERVSAGSAAVFTGLVADTAAVVALLASDTFRRWCKDYWIIPTGLSLLLVYVVIALLEANSRKAGELRILRDTLREPSQHDRTLFSTVTASLHPDGRTVEWLKHGFICTSFEGSLMGPLDALQRSRLRDPRGFDSAEIEPVYRELSACIMRFTRVVNQHMWSDYPDNPSRLAIPREWEVSDPERYEGAMDDLNARSLELVEAYDAFLLTAQRNGVTEVGAEIGSPVV
ncbi:hypothetical protein [Streptomyces sp. NBC_01408]|uniref:hypothetical protein n=1 Tax=Streptomyces sp. NBC_01408 TaxID=2903855 RepID=UPI00224F6E98|nr:hypothetical protein [Streptomyces sp. NBC_01408]MCX4692866.1 hypothetical protein [Streptomyces sp. NBC_01408]